MDEREAERMRVEDECAEGGVWRMCGEGRGVEEFEEEV